MRYVDGPLRTAFSIDACPLPTGLSPLPSRYAGALMERLTSGTVSPPSPPLTGPPVTTWLATSHCFSAIAASSPLSPRFFSLAMHTCPRFGFPHCWHRFLLSWPASRRRRPLSIRCHRLRTEDTVRPGSRWTILLHFGPSRSSISIIIWSSSGSHAFMNSWTPPGIFNRFF